MAGAGGSIAGEGGTLAESVASPSPNPYEDPICQETDYP